MTIPKIKMTGLGLNVPVPGNPDATIPLREDQRAWLESGGAGAIPNSMLGDDFSAKAAESLGLPLPIPAK